MDKVDRLFRAYKRKAPKKKIKKRLTIAKKMFIMGSIESIVYNTDRFGKTIRFVHDFPDHKRIYTDGENLIIPGVEVTERGIED